MKLSPKAFGLSMGILYGLCLFISTLIAIYTGYLNGIMQLLVGIYPWYKVTLGGAFIVLVEGLIDGFVSGFLFAWIYNKVGGGCCGKKCCDK